MMTLKWSGWLEKKGRSKFSKVEPRFFILKEGDSGEYVLEYYSAPAHLKSSIGRDLGDDPGTKGFEKKGSLDVAVRGSKPPFTF